MKQKFWPKFTKALTIFITFVIFCSAMAFSNTIYNNDPALYICNNSDISWHATYLSDNTGSWNAPPNVISAHKLYRSSVVHNELYKSSIFRITIGDKIGEFYCDATLKVPAYTEEPELIYHHGNCHFTRTKSGKLAMVIDSIKPNNPSCKV